MPQATRTLSGPAPRDPLTYFHNSPPSSGTGEPFLLGASVTATVAVIIDYQNIHLTAHDCFAPPGTPKHETLIHPLLFAEQVMKRRRAALTPQWITGVSDLPPIGELAHVAVYRGARSARAFSSWAHGLFSTAQPAKLQLVRRLGRSIGGARNVSHHVELRQLGDIQHAETARSNSSKTNAAAISYLRQPNGDGGSRFAYKIPAHRQSDRSERRHYQGDSLLRLQL